METPSFLFLNSRQCFGCCSKKAFGALKYEFRLPKVDFKKTTLSSMKLEFESLKWRPHGLRASKETTLRQLASRRGARVAVRLGTHLKPAAGFGDLDEKFKLET